MKSRSSKRWLLALLFMVPTLAITQPDSPGGSLLLFEQLLEESGLRFTKPSGFADIQPKANPVLQYERALRDPSGTLEVRFVIRPIGRIFIDYTDPHNASPEPNHLFPLLFQSLTNELSRGGNMPSKEYPQPQARELFNASWAAAAVFDVNPEFSDQYDQALLVGIHEDKLADAYTVFLYNEYAQVKDLINDALATLSFIK